MQINQSDAVQTVSECALWCARLLPLRDCFESSNIEDMLLSVISELPCNNLMVTLLGQNFPDDQQFGSRKRKLDRLVARMRTTIVNKQNSEPQPLSVEYQIMCKAVLEKQGLDACNHFRPQCFQSDNDTHKRRLDEKALTVGSHIFEYDQAYIDFLDNLFSTTLTKPRASLSQSLLKNHHPSHGLSFTTTTKSTIVSPSSANLSSHSGDFRYSLTSLQPVATYLYEWSQSADSTVQTTSIRHKRKDNAAAMRVELSLSFLMYCLQLEEEKHQLDISTHASSLETVTEVERSSTITPVQDDTSTLTTVTDDTSTITTVTAVQDDTSTLTTVTDDTSTITTVTDDTSTITTVTAVQDDTSTITTVTDDTSTPVLESTMTTVTPDIYSTTLSYSTLHAEDLECSNTDRFLNSLPLLQMPRNIFTEVHVFASCCVYTPILSVHFLLHRRTVRSS